MSDLEASIADLAAKLRQHREILKTEEAAKTTLVLPFLRALGYDIFNPAEVRASSQPSRPEAVRRLVARGLHRASRH